MRARMQQDQARMVPDACDLLAPVLTSVSPFHGPVILVTPLACKMQYMGRSGVDSLAASRDIYHAGHQSRASGSLYRPGRLPWLSCPDPSELAWETQIGLPSMH
jgi:hypothetical protein